MAKKKPTSRKSPARKTRARWDIALEPDIVHSLIRPHIISILQVSGATSLTDLHRKLQEATGAAVSRPVFDRWMRHLPEIKALFTTVRVVSLPEPQSHPTPATARQATPTAVAPQDGSTPAEGDEDEDFSEGLPPPPGGVDLPTDIPQRPDWDLAGLMGSMPALR